MTAGSRPLVSVVTPFYNAAPYLEECINSVLTQTYDTFEYILLDNCSTDGSSDIAKRYAGRDSRIRLFHNIHLFPQIPNHNEALRKISPDSRYCKIVQADDWLWPRCLEEMVALAHANRHVGIVGAYTLLGRRFRASVYLSGLPYYSPVMSGKEVCRRFLLEGTYVFGGPTATLIRSEIVRSRPDFYNVNTVAADVDMCLDILRGWDFGFVHQVLTYTRRDNESLMSTLSTFHIMLLAEFLAIRKYGRIFLTEEEAKRRTAEIRKRYFLMLGESALRRREKEFWDFHRQAVGNAGLPWNRWKVRWYSLLAALALLLNPLDTVIALRRWSLRRNNSGARHGAQPG